MSEEKICVKRHFFLKRDEELERKNGIEVTDPVIEELSEKEIEAENKQTSKDTKSTCIIKKKIYDSAVYSSGMSYVEPIYVSLKLINYKVFPGWQVAASSYPVSPTESVPEKHFALPLYDEYLPLKFSPTSQSVTLTKDSDHHFFYLPYITVESKFRVAYIEWYEDYTVADIREYISDSEYSIADEFFYNREPFTGDMVCGVLDTYLKKLNIRSNNYSNLLTNVDKIEMSDGYDTIIYDSEDKKVWIARPARLAYINDLFNQVLIKDATMLPETSNAASYSWQPPIVEEGTSKISLYSYTFLNRQVSLTNSSTDKTGENWLKSITDVSKILSFSSSSSNYRSTENLITLLYLKNDDNRRIYLKSLLTYHSGHKYFSDSIDVGEEIVELYKHDFYAGKAWNPSAEIKTESGKYYRIRSVFPYVNWETGEFIEEPPECLLKIDLQTPKIESTLILPEDKKIVSSITKGPGRLFFFNTNQSSKEKEFNPYL